MSLPTRECGLKFISPILSEHSGPSLPTRECGLKFVTNRTIIVMHSVAPHAGVWIEISLVGNHFLPNSVAPHAGVWIEIFATSLEFIW